MSASVEERVAAGVAYLDERDPGWDEAIDVDRLSMAECGACVLGQLSGDYWNAPVVGERVGPDVRLASLGFDRADHDPDDVYDTLTAEWLRVILARRAEAVSPE